MLSIAGYSVTQPWLLWTFALYAVAGACWLPVVWLQIKMLKIAVATAQYNAELPAHYWRYARYWEWLGYPAFLSVLVIYGLMVFKPAI
jgi:uncharacterized membrane protein